MMTSSEQAFRQAVDKAGGQAATARICSTPERKVTQANVWWWLNKSKIRQCPAEHVLAMEAATGMSRHELRPDIFGAQKQDEDAA